MTAASLAGLNSLTWPYSRHIGRVVEVGDRSAWLDAGSRTFGLDWYDLNSRLLEKASFEGTFFSSLGRGHGSLIKPRPLEVDLASEG